MSRTQSPSNVSSTEKREVANGTRKRWSAPHAMEMTCFMKRQYCKLQRARNDRLGVAISARHPAAAVLFDELIGFLRAPTSRGVLLGGRTRFGPALFDRVND